MQAQGHRPDVGVYNVVIEALSRSGVLLLQLKAAQLFQAAVRQGQLRRAPACPPPPLQMRSRSRPPCARASCGARPGPVPPATRTVPLLRQPPQRRGAPCLSPVHLCCSAACAEAGAGAPFVGFGCRWKQAASARVCKHGGDLAPLRSACTRSCVHLRPPAPARHAWTGRERDADADAAPRRAG